MKKSNRGHGRSVKKSEGRDCKPVATADAKECEKFGEAHDLTRNVSTKIEGTDHWKANRASMAAPEDNVTKMRFTVQKRSFNKPSEKYHKTLYEQYGFDPVSRGTVKRLKDALCGFSPRNSYQVDNSSQCSNPRASKIADLIPKPDQSSWKDIETVDDIEQLLKEEEELMKPKIHISDTPRVIVIAEKFTRFQKDDIEVRKLDKRIVCIEYDVFDAISKKPIQKMRAFFAVKPTRGETDSTFATIPSEILKRLNITEKEFLDLSEKEIEVMDSKITENQTYLDSFKKVLRKKEAINERKTRDTLDLFSMYQMAKRDSPPLDCDYSSTNLLSKAELEEVKDLILKQCDSPDDISRRKVRRKHDANMAMKSESMFLELLRDQKSYT